MLHEARSIRVMARPLPKSRRTQYFREWRQHRQLTQEQAAERMGGMDQGNLSKIERDLLTWDENFLYAAAFAYDCEPDDLFKVNPLKEREVVDLMDKLRKADDNQRQEVDRFVTDYLKIAAS